MSIFLASGDLLAADVDALVNPVNTAGVMGKGLALAFRKSFPESFAPYQRACREKTLFPGRVLVVPRQAPGKFIIHVPTKEHWRSPSRLDILRAGLPALVEEVERHAIGSLAVPALGCGLGGLSWKEVEPLLREGLGGLEARVLLFPPER
jgi:O-acetyl-ADP-ribose deacetylase (regulator of RNase III)